MLYARVLICRAWLACWEKMCFELGRSHVAGGLIVGPGPDCTWVHRHRSPRLLHIGGLITSVYKKILMLVFGSCWPLLVQANLPISNANANPYN